MNPSIVFEDLYMQAQLGNAEEPGKAEKTLRTWVHLGDEIVQEDIYISGSCKSWTWHEFINNAMAVTQIFAAGSKGVVEWLTDWLMGEHTTFQSSPKLPEFL